MLVLTRKKDEGIQIGNGIRIRILEIQGTQVRIGIEAPREVSIVREELFLGVKNDNIESIANEKPDAELIKAFVKGKPPES